ncbi:hypothetical protein DCE79_01495 [Lysinibacillus sp. 2017]|uniref:hypothetical protein n=1 Tax=unclassified Lysinibacillus TaxID=2636778 RepID=UPI000D529E11|nr:MULTISPECIES: hypothetical protein [unclassified Lysinibacillus]AWE06137.1 hypothetical protein DCE79_01495 [Lysinibacillus sp. 2017]TGN35208.1 hypothetical protein E4L99_11135 [Lysinibacillus sp. S2017]
MKNKLFSWIGGVGAVIGFYFLGTYFYHYFTERFVPTLKQFVYFLVDAKVQLSIDTSKDILLHSIMQQVSF